MEIRQLPNPKGFVSEVFSVKFVHFFLVSYISGIIVSFSLASIIGRIFFIFDIILKRYGVNLYSLAVTSTYVFLVSLATLGGLFLVLRCFKTILFLKTLVAITIMGIVAYLITFSFDEPSLDKFLWITGGFLAGLGLPLFFLYFQKQPKISTVLWLSTGSLCGVLFLIFQDALRKWIVLLLGEPVYSLESDLFSFQLSASFFGTLAIFWLLERLRSLKR